MVYYRTATVYNNTVEPLSKAEKEAMRKLGQRGGLARAAKLTLEQRRASAIKASKAAAKARQAKKKRS